jgi:RNA polymerase sigma factor (sigma-70 family)
MGTTMSTAVLGSPAVPPLPEASPAELLDASRRGDPAGWHGLVDRYERLVWSVARSFRYDDATTADVVQTVWLRLAESLDRIREPDSLPAWLATTCRHECSSVGRRRDREVVDDTTVDVRLQRGGWADDVDDDLLERESRREVLDAFGRLSDGCQQLLRLLCAEPPLGYQLIGEVTGRPIGSIGPTRQRCLDKLRAFLEVDHAG